MIIDLPDGTAIGANTGARILLARSRVLAALREVLEPNPYPLVSLGLLRTALRSLRVLETVAAREASDAGGVVKYDLGGGVGMTFGVVPTSTLTDRETASISRALGQA